MFSPNPRKLSRKKRASFRSKVDAIVHAALSKTQACTWIYNVYVIGKKKKIYFLIRRRKDKQTHISIHTIGIGSYTKKSTKTSTKNEARKHAQPKTHTGLWSRKIIPHKVGPRPAQEPLSGKRI
jgi:hypothetical protein